MTTLSGDVVTTLGPVFTNGVHPLVAPARTVPPYAIYQMISGAPLTDFNGQSNVTNARIQITLFGANHVALAALAESAKTAMDAATLFDSVCLNQMDLYEDPAQLYAIALDFSIWRTA